MIRSELSLTELNNLYSKIDLRWSSRARDASNVVVVAYSEAGAIITSITFKNLG